MKRVITDEFQKKFASYKAKAHEEGSSSLVTVRMILNSLLQMKINAFANQNKIRLII